MSATQKGAQAPAVFRFHDSQVRIIEKDGEPWFVCSDVAAALGYATAKDAARNLDDDEKGRQIMPTPGGSQELTIINESGLYALVLRSRKPEARKFAKWVTSEVLPSIRKTGKYELTITPCQQNALQRIVFDKDMSGKKRPYLWSRFNNHFKLGSYKQLPSSLFDEACEYLKHMPVNSEESRTSLALAELYGTKFVVHFDEKGIAVMTPIRSNEIVSSAGDLPWFIKNQPNKIPLETLPAIITACADRLRNNMPNVHRP